MSTQEPTSLSHTRAAQITGPLPAWGPRIGADTGNPQTSGLVIFEGHGVQAGVWECTPGGWSIANRPDTETMHLLAGRVRITAAGQDPVELGAGDAFVLPQGWSGRWDVLETVRKFYVTCD